MRVGVLALQGGFAAHAAVLAQLGHEVTLVRSARELDALDGLVLPGGESSVMLELLRGEAFEAPLDRFVRSGRPVLATCAGLVLAAREVRAPVQPSFGWLDVTVGRNGWGGQLESFEARSDDGAHPLVLIRAPRILDVGAGVEVAATFRGEPVAVRSRRVLGVTFHPELAGDASWHAALFGQAPMQKICTYSS